MSKQILLADDDPVVRHLLGAILQSGGYEVDSVESGTDAIAWFQSRADSKSFPDLVLLDLQLNDMSGTEVLAQIRTVCGENPIPVIMLSANKKEEILRDHPEAADADGFLEKPFPPDVVLQLLSELLD